MLRNMFFVFQFGIFHAKGEEYIIQSPNEMPNSKLRQRYSKFHIFKESIQNVTFDDLVQKGNCRIFL